MSSRVLKDATLNAKCKMANAKCRKQATFDSLHLTFGIQAAFLN